MKKSELQQIIKEEINKLINEENWGSTPSTPIIYKEELSSFFESLIKLNPNSKKIIKEFNLKPTIEIDGFHFKDDTGGIRFIYALGGEVKLLVSLSGVGSKKPFLVINSWSGEGASYRNKNKELQIPIKLDPNSMSGLTLDIIQKLIKKEKPTINKYLDDTLNTWANYKYRFGNFYKGRKLSPGTGD